MSHRVVFNAALLACGLMLLHTSHAAVAPTGGSLILPTRAKDTDMDTSGAAPVPTRAAISASKGPAYTVSADKTQLGVQWLIPSEVGLTRQKAYPEVTVKRGAVVEVMWGGPTPPGGGHNVWLLSSDACPAGPWKAGKGNVVALLAPTAPSGKLSSYPAAQRMLTATPGVRYIACSVGLNNDLEGTHCKMGMLLKVNVV